LITICAEHETRIFQIGVAFKSHLFGDIRTEHFVEFPLVQMSKIGLAWLTETSQYLSKIWLDSVFLIGRSLQD